MKTAALLATALCAIAFGVAASQAANPSVVVFSADRAPTVTGEIYRLDPSGRRVDLSKSPFQDIDPSVSPDGKHVAFFSDRGGKPHAYAVGINGRGLHKIGPALPVLVGGCGPEAAWQPHGTRLLLNVCGSTSKLWIVGAHGKTLTAHANGVLGPQPWSPDGRVFAAFATARGGAGTVRVFSQSGRAIFSIPHAAFQSAWSTTGLLAVQTKSGVAAYDESGHLRFTYHSHGQGAFAWSPDGSKLALDTGAELFVVSSSGQTVLKKSLHGKYGAVWDRNTKVVIDGYGHCGCQAKSVDVSTGKLSAASSRWFDVLSPDGKLAVVTAPLDHGVSFAIGAGPPAGGRAKPYGAVPGCWQDFVRAAAISWQQFAGRSIVYESWGCDPPYANLYSVSPGGGKPQRLTNVQAQETQPALSPDGTTIAYVWAAFTGMSCAGCSDGIRLASADGTPLRTLTDPQDCTFDDSPTWSPDGTTILYSESGCDSAPELFTIPAAGGTPHDLGIAGQQPAWGPTRIAFDGSDGSLSGLLTANPDGSDPVLMNKHGVMPAWSSDGRLAYFLGDLYHRTLVVGSSAPVALPFARVTRLAWTPDGTRIVLVASKTKLGPSDLWTVGTDGRDPVRLTKDFGVNSDYFGEGG